MKIIIGALVGVLMLGTPAGAEERPVSGKYVQQGVEPCVNEDGSGQRVCVWDAKRRGNGDGFSFLSTNHGKRTYVIPHKAARKMSRRWDDFSDWTRHRNTQSSRSIHD